MDQSDSQLKKTHRIRPSPPLVTWREVSADVPESRCPEESIGDSVRERIAVRESI
jgi:hypothetical protein